MNSRDLGHHKNDISEDTGLDPLNTHELLFEEKIFLPLGLSQSQEPKVLPLVFKVMQVKNTQNLVIFVLSEADLYFLYKIEITSETMIYLNHQHQLSLNKITDFVEFFKCSLNDIKNQSKNGQLEIIHEHNRPRLVFELTRRMGGKSHTVMILRGEKGSQQLISEHVAYKYGYIQDRIRQKEVNINQLRELVRLKNPYLLKNFKQL